MGDFFHFLVWSLPKNQQTITREFLGVGSKSKPLELVEKHESSGPLRSGFLKEFFHESSLGPSKGCCWNLKIPLKGKGDTSTQTTKLLGSKW